MSNKNKLSNVESRYTKDNAAYIKMEDDKSREIAQAFEKKIKSTKKLK